jgi:hypothetical protein
MTTALEFRSDASDLGRLRLLRVCLRVKQVQLGRRATGLNKFKHTPLVNSRGEFGSGHAVST